MIRKTRIRPLLQILKENRKKSFKPYTLLMNHLNYEVYFFDDGYFFLLQIGLDVYN